MKKLLVIVPTREREVKILHFFEAFKNNSVLADLCLGLDEDDAHKYPKFDNLPSGDIIYEILPRQGVNGTLNNLAKKYCESYEYIGFLGDDNWVRTHGWDEKLINSIEDLPYGIAYGNDLIQEDKIPTTVIMNSNIIRTLGFMAPPKIKHMYIDNFWKDLGLGLNSLRYLPDVIIEHMHFSKNKAPIDNMYIFTNNSEAFLRDQKEYSKYIAEEFSQDLTKFVSKPVV
jgi:hypothetical protein